MTPCCGMSSRSDPMVPIAAGGAEARRAPDSLISSILGGMIKRLFYCIYPPDQTRSLRHIQPRGLRRLLPRTFGSVERLPLCI